MIPEFLTLSDYERETLNRYEPLLSKVAYEFASKVYETVLNDQILSPLIRDLSVEDAKARIKKYLEIFSAEDQQCKVIADSISDFKNFEISTAKIIDICNAYHKEILNAINSISSFADRQILTFAVFKRINFIMFFHTDKFLKVQNSRLKKREEIYHALVDVSRLWNENDQMALDEILKLTAEMLVKDLNLGLVWVGNVGEDGWVKIRGSAGDAIGYTHNLRVSIDEKSPYGEGPAGVSLRSGKTSILRDFDDPKFKVWRQMAKTYGLGQAAGVPFEDFYGRKWITMMYARVDREMPEYIEDLLDDLSKNLKIFVDRRLSYLEIQRLKGYQEALTQIQRELIKNPPPDAIYKLAVEMITQYTDALTARVSVPDPDSEWMKVISASGKHADTFLNQKIASKDPANHPYGNTSTGRAFRDKKPVIVDNPQADPSFQELWSIHPELKIGAVGSWPIFSEKDTLPVAVLTIHSLNPRYFNQELRMLVEQVISSIETAIKQYDAKKQIEWMALHDALTGLTNRRYFEQSVISAMKRAKREKRYLAIGIADLDDFKLWNDTFGHIVGDELLKKIGNVFQSILRGGDIVSRMGGDEFLFHVMIDNVEDLEIISKRVLKSIYDLEMPQMKITCSLGWAIYPEDGENLENLINLADKVSYTIKQKGGNDYGILNKAWMDKFQRADKVHLEFHKAIEKGDIQFFLQPKCDCFEGKIYGVEMLARWKTENGWIPPDEFIDVVEKDHDLIRTLDCYVLEKAFELREKIKTTGISEISFNIGAKHFLDKNFLKDVTDRINDGHDLKIEITESSAVKDMEMTKYTIESLKEMGFAFSLDDFGTGYSSLIHANLPVDEIKLDKFFVQALRTNANAFTVAVSVLTLGALSGRHVVAEGIETAQDMELWMRMRGRYVQGYFVAKPMEEEELFKWINTSKHLNYKKLRPFLFTDFIILKYAFTDTEHMKTCYCHSEFSKCPMTLWFEKRRLIYGILDHFKEAEEIHKRIHEKVKSNTLKKSDIETMHAIFHNLYLEIAQMVDV
ncbi:MAG: sensor domain-containing phosphodiesterase [Athalassotoga sp.]|uniref:sensor domain-containing phosphodiesterase n=1 Tax=Athalassotoga sp. TaxID=2022597 RepID=UPI003D01C404